jgi:hypothetical protein
MMPKKPGLLLAAVAALSSFAVTASAVTPPMPHVNPRGGKINDTQTGFDVHDSVHFRIELKKLHDEAVRLQAADGGKLSDAHRADLEARLGVLHKEACRLHMTTGC